MKVLTRPLALDAKRVSCHGTIDTPTGPQFHSPGDWIVTDPANSHQRVCLSAEFDRQYRVYQPDPALTPAAVPDPDDAADAALGTAKPMGAK